MFNDGCFNEEADIQVNIITNLRVIKNILGRIGIDEKYLGENLISLVELIKPEITLKELKNSKDWMRNSITKEKRLEAFIREQILYPGINGYKYVDLDDDVLIEKIYLLSWWTMILKF